MNEHSTFIYLFFSIQNRLNEINQSGRAKIQALRRYNEDTYKAWAWIRENRESFKGRVHGPIQLDIKLKDTRYANQVEAALGGADSAHLRTFVCEHESDYKHLTRELADKQGLRITAAWPGNISIEDVMKTPCSPEELKTKYKLDYFVMDLLEGAPIVLAYLCQQAKINLCPLSLRAMDPRPLVDDSPFQSFILDKNSYRVRTYTYGRGGTQTSVRGIHPARVLNDSLDIQARDEVRRVLADLDEEMKVVVMNMDDLNKQQQDLKHKIAELKHAKEDAMSKKRDMVRALQLWEGQKRKLQARKRDLESMMQAPETPNQQLDELKQGIIDEVRKRAQLVLNYKTIAQKYVRTLGQRHAVNIELIGAEERQTKMNGFYRERTSELEQCRKDYEKAKVETSQRRQKAREFSNQAQTAGAELQEELADQFKEIYQQWRANGLEQTPEEIEDQINEQQASYDATRSLNPHAAVTYERIKTEIREMNKKADDSETALAKIGSEIEVIHKQWHPRLKRLVHAISSKFSEGLERIGCAGEVGIYEEDNYENWGIEIRVKFRDTEKLQVLTGQRQSGGERAVSTILYLMSLQKLARSPFRVVDEINQGMDPRNERMIHEQIVKAGTIAGTSQYFLITPKLLPDLYYNENMTVLCVHNGEWLPEKRLRAVEVYLQHAVQNLAAA
ncbi:hypothetical protein DM01DRAFT_186669 [Hesseltinella vesiculosa]|uniref:Structural maintenance of chromosomes protein 5 n=1 Tax=Hesseltinella vesiculosa TaxID=101127 RepID=A0A1X2GJ69_9FUNG|nr:hypothetical protein DM01DRAFT_186669 [Hesseltinella vesiculosa]